MIIKAQYFEPIKGTVFVVSDSTKIAQGVFKTLPSARKLLDIMRKTGCDDATVRVGHFNDAGDIETI